MESAIAWKTALERKEGPSALIFSRQNLVQQPRTPRQLEDAAKKLSVEGRRVQVVSMPCTEAFDAQDTAYRESVLPSAVTARVAVEAGIADFWYKYVGLNGRIVGMRSFGESAPAEQLFAGFGFTVDNVVKTARSVLIQ